MPGAGHVAGGEHVGHRGAQALVDRDPVVDVDSGVRAQVDTRGDADPDDHEVAVDRLAADRSERCATAPSPSNASTPSPSSNSTPCRGGRRGRRRRSPDRRPGSAGSSSGSIKATSSPLWRDEAASSQPIQPAPTTTTRPLPMASRSRSTSESSTCAGSGLLELSARHREPARLGPGGEQQPVVVEHAPSSSVSSASGRCRPTSRWCACAARSGARRVALVVDEGLVALLLAAHDTPSTVGAARTAGRALSRSARRDRRSHARATPPRLWRRPGLRRR